MKKHALFFAAAIAVFGLGIAPSAAAEPVVLSENGSSLRVGTYDMGGDVQFGADGRWLRAGLRFVLTQPRVGPELGLGLRLHERGDFSLLGELDAGAFGGVLDPGDALLRLGFTLPALWQTPWATIQAGPRIEFSGHPRTSATQTRASLMAAVGVTTFMPGIWIWGDLGRVMAPTGGINDAMVGLAVSFDHPWPSPSPEEDPENKG
jgi:hypothetical protein